MKPASGSPAHGLGVWLALIGIGIAWGATQIFSKFLVTAGHDPFGLSLASAALGAVLVTAILIWRRAALPLGRRHLVYYAICGVLGTALPNYTSYTSLRELPVGIVSIIMAAVPLMTFLFALLFRLERPELRRLAGLVLGGASVLILVGPDASLPRPGDALWVGVALVTGLSYAAENIYIAEARPAECGPLQTLCGLQWMATAMVLPIVLATGTGMSADAPAVDWAALGAMSVLHLTAYGGFVWLIGRGGAVFAAQVGYVVTLSGILLGMAVFGERHAPWVWLSVLLMLSGLALVQPRAAAARIAPDAAQPLRK